MSWVKDKHICVSCTMVLIPYCHGSLLSPLWPKCDSCRRSVAMVFVLQTRKVVFSVFFHFHYHEMRKSAPLRKGTYVRWSIGAIESKKKKKNLLLQVLRKKCVFHKYFIYAEKISFSMLSNLRVNQTSNLGYSGYRSFSICKWCICYVSPVPKTNFRY